MTANGSRSAALPCDSACKTATRVEMTCVAVLHLPFILSTPPADVTGGITAHESESNPKSERHVDAGTVTLNMSLDVFAI